MAGASALGLGALLGGPAGAAASLLEPAAGEWPAYGATNAAPKYSPLAQIDRANVGDLKIAWEWLSPDAEILKANPDLKPGEFQATPIMVGGVLYTSTAMCQVAAIDAITGRTLWVYDPGNWRHARTLSKGFQHRGVAYWGEGDSARIIIGTGDNRLIALDAKSGKPIPSFGTDGVVDLASVGLQRAVDDPSYILFGSISPPLICRDVIVIGQWVHDREAAPVMPAGDVRGFDVRTGELRWTFHTVPRKGEFGYETWLDGSAEKNGNGNIWAPMSADDDLGLVYLP
ncbi:MAG: PQQ-binding-like beta-propeller repeat protein, partial [Caulobacteraceae bacterium]|nr:PQQ-binding-like beta-propeller repeat protein [Caulobacteraceae bacterium]